MKKLLFVFLAVVLVMSVFAGGGGQQKAPAAQQKITLKWAELLGPDYVTTVAAKKLAEHVSKKSDGRITIEIYDSMVLGDEKSTMQSVQMGAVDFFRGSALTTGDFGAKKMNVLGLPFVFSSNEHLWKVLESNIGKEILDNVQQSGSKMVGVGFFGEGSRHFFFTKKEVKTLADFKGLKIRVPQTQLMMDMVDALGANATPISYSELYSALQTGVVDGAENALPSYYSNSFYEVAKYVVRSYHSFSAYPILASEITWGKLSAADKAIIAEGLDVAREWNKKEAAKADSDAYNALISRGVVINDTNLAEWQASVGPVYRKYAADYMNILDAIQKMK